MTRVFQDSRHALIIGTDRYDDPGLGRLQSPPHDAEKLREVLTNEFIGDYHVKTALNQPDGQIKEEIEGFLTGRKPEDLTLLYISGHGIKDPSGKLHFAAKTTKLGRLGATAIAADFIYDLVERCRSRNIVIILDCCFSGAYLRGHIPRADAKVDLSPPDGRGWVVITSSTALEYSFEVETWRSTGLAVPSVFTAALIEGLRTGNADRDKDGLISANDLYDYVFDEVRRTTPAQTPEIKFGNIRGQIIVAHNPHIVRVKPRPFGTGSAQGARDDGRRSTPEFSLDDTYADALSAYYAERWQDAVDGFQAILAKNSDFRDAPAKNRHASHQLHMADQYSAGILAAEAENWTVAVEVFEELQAAEPGYRDVAGRLNMARIGAETAALITEAEKHLRSGRFSDVVNVCTALSAIAAKLDNEAGALEADARLRIRVRETSLRYRLALEYFENHDWSAALGQLNVVNFSIPSYRDTVPLINRARAQLTNFSPPEGEPTMLGSFPVPVPVDSMAFSPDGQVLCVATPDSVITWEIATGRRLLRIGHESVHDGLAISPDGQRLARVGGDHVKVWNTATADELLTIRKRHIETATLAFLPDGDRLAASTFDGNVLIWSAVDGSLVRKIPVTERYNSFRLAAADGDRFAFTNYRQLGIGDLTSDDPPIKRIPLPERALPSTLALSPDGTRVALVRQNGQAVVWDTSTGGVLRRIRQPGFPGGAFGIKRLSFSPDGQRIATVGGTRKARIWDAATGVEILAIPDADHIACSPDPLIVATASQRSVSVWLLPRRPG